MRSPGDPPKKVEPRFPTFTQNSPARVSWSQTCVAVSVWMADRAYRRRGRTFARTKHCPGMLQNQFQKNQKKTKIGPQEVASFCIFGDRFWIKLGFCNSKFMQKKLFWMRFWANFMCLAVVLRLNFEPNFSIFSSNYKISEPNFCIFSYGYNYFEPNFCFVSRVSGAGFTAVISKFLSPNFFRVDSDFS